MLLTLEPLNNRKVKIALTVLPIAAVFTIVIGIALGSTSISVSDILHVFAVKIFGANENGLSPAVITIIWEIRLPRVLLAFLVGAALSASGAVVQSVLRNPLASPFTLGVSSGASLGAGLVIVFSSAMSFLSAIALPLSGFVFGFATVVISLLFATAVSKNLEGNTIVLCGMVLSMFINAVFMLVAGFSGEKMQQIIKWQMGSFASKGWESNYILFFVTAVGIFILLFYSKELDIMTFGENDALSLGVDIRRVKWIVLLISSVLTGVAVAFSGVIGFVDLVAPHIIRKAVTSKHRYVVVLSALLGGILMVVADLCARFVVAPRELPVGAVTALIGAPFFAYIFLRRKKTNA